MDTQLLNFVRPVAALLAGGIVGLGFGALQQAALNRHRRLQAEGKFTTGWAAMPGSFRRVAYLLVALAIMQFLCPVFFAAGGISQWCVSAGVVIGYGWMLFGQLRTRRT